MDNFNKSMEDVFDMVPTETVKATPVAINPVPAVVKEAPVATQKDKDLDEDYDEVRQNYQDILSMGKEAISDMKDLAAEMQHPRAFEVLGGLIKNVVEANEKFIGLHKTMKEMDKLKGGGGGNTTIDKAIFVGSTKDLATMLKNKDKENKNENNGDNI